MGLNFVTFPFFIEGGKMKQLMGFVLSTILLTSAAQAFSVKIHVFYANKIIEDLEQSMGADRNGEPYLHLIGPDNASKYRVKIKRQDALDILENPLHFRGGAIGPDNTAFSGLTDPSHSPKYKPFTQCENLYRTAKTGAEKAYGMGCFLHGITDNVAHHIVNFFSTQTFTMNPILVAEAQENGELLLRPNETHQTNLLNVVNHIFTETTIEKAYKKTFEEDFTPYKFQHKIATNLYQRVYLNPTHTKYAFNKIIQPIKNKLASELANMDQTGKKEFSRSYLTRKINTYASFLKNSVSAPYEKVLFLPVVLKDIHGIMSGFQKRSERKIKECAEAGFLKKRGPICIATRHLYARTKENNFQSRFDKYIWSRQKNLNQILHAQIKSLKNLSNLLTTSGAIELLKVTSIEEAFRPFEDKISEFMAPPYELLPSTVQAALKKIGKLNDFIITYEEMIKKVIYGVIYDAFQGFIIELKEKLIALKELSSELISEQMHQMLSELKETLKETMRGVIRDSQLELLGRDSDDLYFDLLGHIPSSVVHMNAYNSIVGVLADHDAVIDTSKTLKLHYDPNEKENTYDFTGPVSFDASFQLDYNQMKLCPQYTEAFYPCGTKANEMLQPGGYKECMKLPATVKGEPPVECFKGISTQYATLPDIGNCKPNSMENVNSKTPVHGHGLHEGSYSLSFPPAYLPEDVQPKCRSNYQVELELVQE